MIGTELNRLRIVKELGQGGMGTVYLAVDLEDEAPFAIKILHKEVTKNREDVARFLREANIQKRLIHPNLMRFHDFGFRQEVGFFLVTELLEGRDLEEILNEHDTRHPMLLERVLDIVLQVCAGLETAHREGIVHRDLKPGNIFVLHEGEEEERVKVFDFGIGKDLEQDISGPVTMHGMALGTPLYMAPEQARGRKEAIGPTLDIYALGVILFQMIAGELPFTGKTPMDILVGHLQKPPPPLRKHRKELAGTALEALVLQMMEKEPGDRPQTMDEVRDLIWEARLSLQAPEQSKTLMEMPSFFALEGEASQNNGENGHSSPDNGATPMSRPEDPVGVLVLKKEDGEKEEVGWFLPGYSFQIGSQRACSVRIRAPGVLPVHAEASCSPEGWIEIRKVGEAVVRINGASIFSMILSEGDIITIGEAEMVLHRFR